MELLWKRLEKYFNGLESKISLDTYLSMCEQLGKEPNIDEMPPEWDEFPDTVQQAINTFNMLGDRIYPEIGYIGKDFSLLPILINNLDISNLDLFIDTLLWLDNRAIKKSSEALKKEYDKLKRKSHGPK